MPQPTNFSSFDCPACGASGNFIYHSHYSKYYFHISILIHVLKCLSCNKHHSLLPSFSLPGTSLGTHEVEEYIISREKGATRREAGNELLSKGVSFKHLSYIEKVIKVCLLRFEALIPGHLNTKEFLMGFILAFNLLCLENRINAIFCNRVNILIFHKRKAGRIYSNDLGSSRPAPPILDSS